MKFILILLICVLWSCHPNQVSEKEVILLSGQYLDSIIKDHDSLTISSPSGKLYATVKTYHWKDRPESIRFLLDSLGNIKTIITLKEGKYLKSSHYYSNGQLKGQLSYTERGILDGPGKYYYENGRIKSQGTFENNHPIGEWRYYNEKGSLELILLYDDRGELLDSIIK